MAENRISSLQDTAIAPSRLETDEERRRKQQQAGSAPAPQVAPTMTPAPPPMNAPQRTTQTQQPQPGFTTSGGFNPTTFMSVFQPAGMSVGSVPPQSSDIGLALNIGTRDPRDPVDPVNPVDPVDPGDGGTGGGTGGTGGGGDGGGGTGGGLIVPQIGGGGTGFTEGDLPRVLTQDLPKRGETGPIGDGIGMPGGDVPGVIGPGDPIGPPGEMSDLEQFLRDIIFGLGEFEQKDLPFNEDVAADTQARLFADLEDQFAQSRQASDLGFNRRGMFFSSPALARQDELRGQQARAQGDITSQIALEQARAADEFQEQQFQRRMQALSSLFGFGQNQFQNQVTLQQLESGEQQKFLEFLLTLLGGV